MTDWECPRSTGFWTALWGRRSHLSSGLRQGQVKTVPGVSGLLVSVSHIQCVAVHNHKENLNVLSIFMTLYWATLTAVLGWGWTPCKDISCCVVRLSVRRECRRIALGEELSLCGHAALGPWWTAMSCWLPREGPCPSNNCEPEFFGLPRPV